MFHLASAQTPSAMARHSESFTSGRVCGTLSWFVP